LGAPWWANVITVVFRKTSVTMTGPLLTLVAPVLVLAAEIAWLIADP
jgi:hypothetical protein